MLYILCNTVPARTVAGSRSPPLEVLGTQTSVLANLRKNHRPQFPLS